MAAIGPTTANNLLNALLRGTAFTGPATVYLSLHTADPGTTGAGEVTGGSYARQSVTSAIAAAGSSSNSAAVTFNGMPAVTVAYVGLYDAATAGNFLWGGAMTVSQVLAAGNSLSFAINQITVTEN